jgi:monoamine oxidase
MRVLRTIYGPSIPEPVGMARSTWERDPFARGSYAHAPVGAADRDHDVLAEPVGRLSFAGEATHRAQSGTVHGALLSGIREARRLAGR